MNKKLLLTESELFELKNDLNAPAIKLAPDCIVDYTVLKVGDGEYEILEREVTYNDNQYCDYDDEAVSCWEVLDMNGFIGDNFDDIGLGGSMEFTVRLSMSYHTDYYGESDVDIEVELL